MNRLIVLEDDPGFSEVLARMHKAIPRVMGGAAELVAIQSLGMLKHILAVNSVSLIVMDLTLPDSPQDATIEFIGLNREIYPPIFVICGDERIVVREKCIAAGVVGFAEKKHIVESPNFFFAEVFNQYLRRLDHGR